MNGDIYNVGQAAAVGRGAQAHNARFGQGGPEQLREELVLLARSLRSDAQAQPDVHHLEQAADLMQSGNETAARHRLSRVSNKALASAEKLGIAVAASAIAQALGVA